MKKHSLSVALVGALFSMTFCMCSTPHKSEDVVFERVTPWVGKTMPCQVSMDACSIQH